MSEEWREVKGYEGLYEVSDLGRVRSLDRIVTMPNGAERLHLGRILKPAIKKNGYAQVVLQNQTRPVHVGVHRLVLWAFSGPCPDGFEASHLNGSRSDNRLENLRWESRQENLARRESHGTSPKGSGNPKARLTEADVQNIRIFANTEHGLTQKEIGALWGVSETTINHILHRRTWSHLCK